MRENLKQSRRKDDILIGYYFVCVYICLKESKKEKKASDLAFSLTPSRSFFPHCYVLPLPLLHGSRKPPPPRHCRHCECHHHAPPSRARSRRRAALAAASPSSSPWFSGENHLKPPPSLSVFRRTARRFQEPTP